MADKNNLRTQISIMRQSFFDEGMLDQHYVQLEELEEDNPHFAEEVMDMFFRDSTKLLGTLESALSSPEVDCTQIDRHLHQLKGSSSSVGAVKVFSEVNKLREILKEGDMGRFSDHFAQLKVEHGKLQVHLDVYFQMLAQLDLFCQSSAKESTMVQRPQFKCKKWSICATVLVVLVVVFCSEINDTLLWCLAEKINMNYFE